MMVFSAEMSMTGNLRIEHENPKRLPSGPAMPAAPEPTITGMASMPPVPMNLTANRSEAHLPANG